MSKLGIVTVLFNSATVLKEYFESLEAQTFKNFTLYIVDNKSTDDSLKTAYKLAESVSFACVFLPQEQNWGVAKGNNIGIRAALADGCPYVLLSNNDIVLTNNNTLELLVAKMDNSDIDILCPKIYYYDEPKRIWAAGGDYVHYDTSTIHYGSKEIDKGQYDKETPIRYTPTCFVILRSIVFERIGYMDEWYFVYYDDTDFMYRAWKANVKIYYTPITCIYHKESTSTGLNSPFKMYQATHNQFYFVRKHRPLGVYVWLITLKFAVLLLKHTWQQPYSILKSEIKGIIDGFKETCRRKYLQ